MLIIEKPKIFVFSAKCSVRFQPAIGEVSFYKELPSSLQTKSTLVDVRTIKPTNLEYEAIESVISTMYTNEELVDLINHFAKRAEQRALTPLMNNMVHKVGFVADEYLYRNKGNIREVNKRLDIL